MEALRIGPDTDRFIDTTPILPAQPVSLRNPLVHTNLADLGEPARAQHLQAGSTARHILQPAVLLGRYPPGSLLGGTGSPQILLPDGSFAGHPALPGEDLNASLAATLARRHTAIDVAHPCVLAFRAGIWCWGHWLLDMLPKIVLAERLHPGRFTFVVAAEIVARAAGPTQSPRYPQSVRDSLHAYGIEERRLLRIKRPQLYRFTDLFDVTGIDGSLPHPGTLDALRHLANPPPPQPPRPLTAALRTPPSPRRLADDRPIRAALQNDGAAFIDLATASFADQISAFRDSDLIVGDLGSNLAGMIYARSGTGVVSLAPTHWDDTYFAHLFQRLDVVHADLRGPSHPPDAADPGHAPYTVDPGHLRGGMGKVRQGLLV
jgi:hypothetical protein